MRSQVLTELSLLFEPPSSTYKSHVGNPPSGNASGTIDKCRKPNESHPRSPSSAGSLLNGFTTIWDDSALPMTDISAEMRMSSLLAERTQCFINEFQARFKSRKTWADARLHFSVVENPATRQSIILPLPASPQLNPRATPFVSCRSLTTPSPQEKFSEPAWFDAFCAGTQGCSTMEQKELSYDIVFGRKWDTNTITELAKYFVWRGGEGLSPHHATVAIFAKAMYVRLGATYGDWYRQEFMWRMREYAISAFKVLLTSNRPTLATDVAYISSMLSLTAFIGDLFTCELLPASQIHVCLSFLSQHAKAIEHVHAMHLLLVHSGRKIWKLQSVWNFVIKFETHIRTSGAITMSLVGRKLQDKEASKWILEIRDMVTRWRLQGYLASRGCCHDDSADNSYTDDFGQLV